MTDLRFGVATRDITPRSPQWAHGYAARNRPSSGVREPLSLGCLAVSDDDTTLLLVSLDMIGVRADVCQRLYGLLADEVGVGYPHVALCGSHTHFAPALHGSSYSDPQVGFVDPDPGYVASVEARLLEAAVEALDDLRPRRLQTARIQVPQVVYNRRTVRRDDGRVEMNLRYPADATPYAFSPVDAELTVLRLVDDDGVHAAWTNFGCHPVTGCSPDDDAYRFSADYPHYLRQTLGEAWACPVLFSLGAAGDAVPIDRKGDRRQRIGAILGHAAALAERTFTDDDEATLSAEVVEVEAETILQTDAAAAEAGFTAASQAVAAAGAAPGADLVDTWRAAARAVGRARLYPDNRWRIPVQLLRIGSTALVGLPFEVLAETALTMKARAPRSLLLSCCGGYQGYLPLAHEYERGGYEATESSTHFVPGTADRILEVILEHLGEDR